MLKIVVSFLFIFWFFELKTQEINRNDKNKFHNLKVAFTNHHNERTCVLRGTDLYCWGGMYTYGVELIKKNVVDYSIGKKDVCVTDTSGDFWCSRYINIPFYKKFKNVKKFTVNIAAGTGLCFIYKESLRCEGYNKGNFSGAGKEFYSGEVHTDRNYIKSDKPIKGFEKGVTDVVAGYYSTCVIQHGQIKCWGYNYSGTVNGIPEYFHNPLEGVVKKLKSQGIKVRDYQDVYLEPVLLFEGKEATRLIEARSDYLCAEFKDGDMYCWGNFSENSNQFIPEHIMKRERIIKDGYLFANVYKVILKDFKRPLIDVSMSYHPAIPFKMSFVGQNRKTIHYIYNSFMVHREDKEFVVKSQTQHRQATHYALKRKKNSKSGKVYSIYDYDEFTDLTEVALGYKHSCVIVQNQTRVYCWGENEGDFYLGGQPNPEDIVNRDKKDLNYHSAWGFPVHVKFP